MSRKQNIGAAGLIMTSHYPRRRKVDITTGTTIVTGRPCLTPQSPATKLKSMFGAMSWIRRTGVSVFLLASLCAGTVALPHADGLDDVACSPVAVSHNESAHHFRAASSSRESDAQHCFLCHSLRSFYPGFEKYEQRDGAFRTERLHASLVAPADRLDWSLAPGRAPPA